MVRVVHVQQAVPMYVYTYTMVRGEFDFMKRQAAIDTGCFRQFYIL